MTKEEFYDNYETNPDETVKLLNKEIENLKSPSSNYPAFNEIKKFLNEQGYYYRNGNFSKDNIPITRNRKQEDELDENPILLISSYYKNGVELKKQSFQMYPETVEELKEVFDKYSFIRSADILNTIIKEGIKALTEIKP